MSDLLVVSELLAKKLTVGDQNCGGLIRSTEKIPPPPSMAGAVVGAVQSEPPPRATAAAAPFCRSCYPSTFPPLLVVS